MEGQEAMSAEIQSRASFFKLLDTPDLLEAAAEVGVAEGRYAEQILSWGIGKLYLVDLWAHVPGVKGCLGEPHHSENLAACEKIAARHPGKVVLLKGWSWEQAKHVPDGSLGFVHLDACHYYESVKKDLPAWWRKLKPRGVMSGHDYLAVEYTIKQAVDEFAAANGIQVFVDNPSDDRNASFYFRKPG
jgi:hypothetical protein